MPGIHDDYEVVLLGDLHFTRAKGTRYWEMWQSRMPSLMTAAAHDVGTNARFVLQIGDVIDGDASDRAAHTRMMSDAWALLKRTFPDCPISLVVGNHDIRGKEGSAAYREFFLPRLSRELKRDFPSTTYAYSIGDDAFLHFDFNDPDSSLSVLARLLNETKSARHLFFVSHAPVIPNYYGGPSYRGMTLGDVAHTEARRWLLERLAARHAIVLTGHIHKTDFLEWRSAAGKIVQITVSSVWDDPSFGRPKTRYQGSDEYARPWMTGTDLEAKAFFSEYAPGICRYQNILAAGRSILRVSEHAVSVEVFCGNEGMSGVSFKCDTI